jgi:hypothetical protein
MLLRTMFLLALLALLAETFVHGAGALARVALQHRELAATRAAFSAAVSAAQQSAARAIAAGQSPSLVLPSPFATCYDATSTGCAIAATASISTPTPAALPSPPACPQTDCTIYLQANSAVAESRVAYHISTTVTAANGDALVSRAGDGAFRTFTAPPYASLVGSLDATLDALENGGAGDDGGNASAAGTLITVEYVPSGAGSSPIPGNVWHAQDEHPATSAPAWDR